MIIELTEDVQVRVPEHKLPFGAPQTFVTINKGAKVNYSSERRDPDHKLHKFSCYTAKYGILEFACVTPFNEVPPWL